jgi:pyruvyl transferase EpsO
VNRHAVTGGPLIEGQRAHIDQLLDGLLRPDEPMALIDYPPGGNVGDQAIWLGTTEYLASRPQYDVKYITDRFKYSAATLARTVPPGSTILLHGGGNLGDDYPLTQKFREDLVDRFHDRRIIQMPQTIHFARPEAARTAAKAFNRHPDLTLLVRDHQSEVWARETFHCRIEVCPDMAFNLDLPQPGPPEHQVVWLARTDSEHRHVAVKRPGVLVTDWFDHVPGYLRWAPQYWSHVLSSLALAHVAASPPVLRRARIRGLDAPAHRFLSPGVRLLSRGEVVITDRLHGHILSILTGLPNVLLDNSYGKVRSYYESWTRHSDRTWWVSSPAEALDLAMSLNRDSRC